jgi:cell division protein FtsQ
LGNQYYIDVNGIKFPLSRHFTPRVPVLSGDIPPFNVPVSEMDDKSVIKQAFRLWELISYDSFLEALVEQIFVDEEGDLILIPKVGTHKIIFGRFDDSVAERLENLKIFYQEGMPYEGWDKYKSLSIKYRDQVVAVAH